MTPCIDCEDGTCCKHRPTHTDMLAYAAAYDEDLRAEGRREMLWLMAVGACWGCWFSVYDWHPDAMIALHDVSMAALRALADMGDERAREMLR